MSGRSTNGLLLEEPQSHWRRTCYHLNYVQLPGQYICLKLHSNPSYSVNHKAQLCVVYSVTE